MKCIIFVLLIFSFSTWAQDVEVLRKKAAEMQQRCNTVTDKLQVHLNTLDRICKTVADCEPKYFNVRSCDPPIIIAKTAKIDKKLLVQLQNEVRKACGDLFKGPICEPLPSQPLCHEGKCIDRSALPPKKLPDLDKSLLKRPFKFGIVRASCAPHDATSMEFSLTQDPITCETKFNQRDLNSLNINIWHPEFIKGPEKGSDWGITSRSGIGSVCAGGGCSNIFNSVRIQIIDVQKEKFIRGKIEAVTDDNFKIPLQEFNAIWCPSHQVCG